MLGCLSWRILGNAFYHCHLTATIEYVDVHTCYHLTTTILACSFPSVEELLRETTVFHEDLLPSCPTVEGGYAVSEPAYEQVDLNLLAG